MNDQLIVVAITVGTTFLLIVGMLVLMAKFYRRVSPSEALVVTTPGGTRVFFNGGVVYPFSTAEVVDLTSKAVACACKGRDALATRDGTRLDVEATFVVQAPKESERLVRAVRELGTARIGSAKALEEHFATRFARALADVMHAMTFEDVQKDRSRLEEEVTKVLGSELQGLELVRVDVTRVEQTPADPVGPFR